MPEIEIKTSGAEPETTWFEEMRGTIMVVAVLVASITYSAGLSPPGGVWQDDNNGHKAGYPVLYRDPTRTRYLIFFYANASAFMASLVIIVLIMNNSDPFRVIMLNISMVLDLVSLMIAFAAGCARNFNTSIYVIVLAVVVLLFVVYTARSLPRICDVARKRAPWMVNCFGKDFMRAGNDP